MTTTTIRNINGGVSRTPVLTDAIETENASNVGGWSVLSAVQTLLFTSPTFAAGDATHAAATLTSGTVKTTAGAGDFEYDGKVFYANAVASARQVMRATQFSINTADVTLTDDNSAQTYLTSGRTGVTLQASTDYQFEALISLFSSTTTTSHTTSTLFALSGGLTLTDISYLVQGLGVAAAGAGNAGMGFRTAATAVVAIAANTSVENDLYMRGTIRVANGGVLTPQIQFSAAPGNTPKARNGSFFTIWAIGGPAVGSAGAWA